MEHSKCGRFIWQKILSSVTKTPVFPFETGETGVFNYNFKIIHATICLGGFS